MYSGTKAGFPRQKRIAPGTSCGARQSIGPEGGIFRLNQPAECGAQSGCRAWFQYATAIPVVASSHL